MSCHVSHQLSVLATSVDNRLQTLDDGLELVERLVVGVQIEHTTIELCKNIVGSALDFVYHAGQLYGLTQVDPHGHDGTERQGGHLGQHDSTEDFPANSAQPAGQSGAGDRRSDDVRSRHRQTEKRRNLYDNGSTTFGAEAVNGMERSDLFIQCANKPEGPHG
jgi:hypothetical protein